MTMVGGCTVTQARVFFKSSSDDYNMQSVLRTFDLYADDSQFYITRSQCCAPHANWISPSCCLQKLRHQNEISLSPIVLTQILQTIIIGLTFIIFLFVFFMS